MQCMAKHRMYGESVKISTDKYLFFDAQPTMTVISITIRAKDKHRMYGENVWTITDCMETMHGQA